MALLIQSANFGVFGGLNVADPPDELMERSHIFANGRWAHRSGPFGIVPVESPSLQNIDFERNELRKRKGSSELADFTAAGLNILLSTDVIVSDIEFVSPVTNARIAVAVSKLSIYTDQSGTFAQINNGDGVAYTHSVQTVTKVSLALHDGHLFIGLNGANAIQVYRSGADLDDQLNNNTTVTLVDADSASGQAVLNVAATTMFLINDRVNIDADSSGGGQEYGYVKSISAGVSITLHSNLTNTHTAVQADEVKVDNAYTEAFGGAAKAVTGSWNTGYFMVEGSHGHLAFSNGDSVAEFTAVNAPYDRANGGFYQARGAIKAMKAFTPKFTSELREVIFLFTELGFEYFGGFEIYDLLEKIDAPGPLNHQVVAATENWLMYLTAQGGIAATDGRVVIDMGRRLKAGNIITGILDQINLTGSATVAHTFYDETKKQVWWGFSTSASEVVDLFAGLDMQLGEPIPGESLASFESHVRPLKWTGLNYVSIYQALGSTVGVRATGFLYTLESGDSDFDTVAIDGRWFSPVFKAGLPVNEKQWLTLFTRGLSKGDFDVFVNYYLDRSIDASAQFVFNQGKNQAVWDTAVWDVDVWSDQILIKGSDDTDLISDSIQLEIFNDQAGETFTTTDIELRYQNLAEER